MSDMTMPVGHGAEVAWLRAQLNPHGIGGLHDPTTGSWIAFWGPRGYAQARTATELRTRVAEAIPDEKHPASHSGSDRRETVAPERTPRP